MNIGRHPIHRLALLALGLLAAGAAAAQEPPSPQQRVEMLKAWLAASQQQIRQYQWIETTRLAKGGEVKHEARNEVYYGVDGTLVKVPIGEPQKAKAPRGPLRRRAAAQAKEDLTAYLQSAVELVHGYIPPDPARLQQAYAEGRFSLAPVEPGKRSRLQFADYLKRGDSLGVEVEVPTNRLLALSVSSYLEDASDAVQMETATGLLPDGTIYTRTTTLRAPAKDIVVTVENSGYRPRDN